MNPTPSVSAVGNARVRKPGGGQRVQLQRHRYELRLEQRPSVDQAGSERDWQHRIFTAVNACSTPVVVTITVTPLVVRVKLHASGVDDLHGDQQPTPAVNRGSGKMACDGASTVAVPFSGTATQFTWTNDNTSVGLAASGTGNIGSFTAVNTGSSPSVATVTVTPVYGSCTGSSTTFTITVNPTPVVNDPADQVVCNSAATTTVVFGGTATSYDWSNDTPSIGLAASGTGNIASFSAVNTGSSPVVATITVTPRYTFGAVTCTGPVQTFTITVNPTPVVNPIANQSLCAGSSTAAVTFSGTATGYTWTNDTPSIGLPAGGTGNIASFIAINNGNSPVVATITATAGFGSCTTGTQVFTITVNPNPSFSVSNNASNICSGQATNLAFSSATAGHQINVVSVNYGAVTGGTVVAGTTVFTNGNVLAENLLNNTNAAIDVVYTFNVTTPTTPVCPLVPVNQSITVHVQPNPVFTLTNSTTQICSGTQALITLNTPVTGAQVRLQSVSYGAVSGTLTSGILFSNGQQITEVLVNNTNSPATVTYTFEAIVGSCGPSATQTTSVIVNPNPSFTVTNSNPVICSGTATNIAFASPTTGHSINVVSVNYGAVTGGAVVAGTTTFVNGNVLTETLNNNTNAAIDVVYTFNVTTPSTTPACPVVVTNQVITVRVLPTPTFSLVNSATQICSGSQSNITLSTTVTSAQIRLSAVNYGAVSGSQSPGILFTNGQQLAEVLLNNTNAPVTVIYTFEAVVGGCTPSATQTASVIVNPNPTFTATNNSSNICSGGVTNISFASPTAGHVINVVSVNYGAVSGGTVSAGSTTFSNGSVLTETLTNNTNNSIDVVYVFNVTTPTTPNCPLIPSNRTITVTVQPTSTFTITNTATQFCSGNQTNITLNSPVAGVQIRLANVNYGTAIGTLSAGAVYTNGQQIKEVLVNNTNAPVTVVYTFEAVVAGCTPSLQQTSSVIVDPIPTLATNLNTQDLCEGQQPTLSLTNPNNVAGTLYTWTISTTNVVGAANQPTPVAASAINTNLTLSSGSVGSLVYNVRSVANGCYSSIEGITLNVRKQPTVSVPANVAQCEPASIPLNGTIGGSATSALWSVISGAGSLSATNVVAGAPIAANASYTPAPTDISSNVTMRLTSNDPDGPAGLCAIVSADYTITINRSAKVNAGPDLAQCEDVPSIQLQGSSAYSPNGVQWSLVTAAGVIDVPSSLTPNYSFANPSEVNQTVTLRLTAFDPDGPGAGGPCTNVSDDMTVRINKLPIVSYVGFPDPAVMAENEPTRKLTGNQFGGVFTIAPITSLIGPTTQNPTDEVVFNPAIVTLGPNQVRYTYTDGNGCTAFDEQTVIINPVTNVLFDIAAPATKNLTTQEWNICANSGKVLLVGTPTVQSGRGPETRFHMSPDFPVGLHTGAVLSFSVSIAGDYYIDTDNAVSDTYVVRYTYKNNFNAITYYEQTVNILASPLAQVAVNNSCVKDVIQFNDASTLPSTPFGATISAWRWDFNDQSFSNFQNPSHGYLTSGYYNIELIATTSQGCSGIAKKQIRVGDEPIVKFDLSAFCNNEKTKFVDGSSAGISNIITYHWDFGDGNSITGAPNIPIVGDPITSGTFNKPEHNYAIAGPYTVTLQINTDDGCQNQLSQRVVIFDYITVAPSATAAYFQDFEKGGWSAESLWKEKQLNPIDSTRYSWIIGVPKGNIQPNAAGPNAWWTGARNTNANPRFANPDTYFKSETSAVNGPCFNLKNLQRPMISLDYWSDAESNRDGAALQYSVDGGFTWDLVGPLSGSPLDQGIGWYNSQGIVGKPGNQRAAGDYGWSGRTRGWKNARYNLDMIDSSKRDQVRFRIAFGSDDANDDSNGKFDGFAFDNVFVGDKKRIVLVEHFTSIDAGSIIANNAVNALYDGQVTDRAGYGGKADFQNIQYHINSSTPDQLYKDNEIDQGTRALFMSVSAPPTTIMDGLRNSKFTGSFLEVNRIEIDRRSLVDPLFTMVLDTVAIDVANVPLASNKLHPKVTLTAQQAFTTPLTLNVALVEDVGTNRNVLRKLLFGPEGLTITNAIANGEIIIREKGPIELNTAIANPNGLKMIAFIQDRVTKEIYQSAVLKAPHKVGAAVVGLDESNTEVGVVTKKIQVFPNPASQRFYFGVPDGFKDGENYHWRVVDQRGVIVREGDFSSIANGQMEVPTNDLANAMYIVSIQGPDKSVSYHKLIVMNRP